MVGAWAGGGALLFWAGFVAALVAAMYLLHWTMKAVNWLVGRWLR